MPVVPRYNNGSTQIQQSGAPNVRLTDRVSSEAFNAGPSMDKVLSTTQKLFEKAKQEGDEIAVTEAIARRTQAETDLKYNQDTGIFNKKGKDAFNSMEGSFDSIKKMDDDIESSLSNDVQKSYYRKKAMGAQQEFYSAVNRHAATEKVTYDNQVTESSLSAFRDTVAKNPYDQAVVADALNGQREAFLTYASRNGMSEEATAQKMLEITSKTHATAIDSMLNSGKYSYAKQYFDANKENLNATDISRVEKNVKEGSLRVEAQGIADDLTVKGLPVGQALIELRKIEDPDLREKATQHWRQNKQYEDIAKRDAEERINVEAANIIDKNGGDLSKLPPGKFNSLTTQGRSAIQSYAATRSRGEEPKTDWSVYNNIIQKASTPELQDEFMREDLITNYRNKLSDSEFKEVVKLQSGLRKGDDKIKGELDDYRTKTSIVTDTVKSMGIDRGSAKANAFESAVASQQRSKQTQLGRKLTNEEMEGIVQKLAIKVAIPWASDTFLFETDENKIKINDIDDVPENYLKQIKESLARRGMPTDDASILKIYNDFLKAK